MDRIRERAIRVTLRYAMADGGLQAEHVRDPQRREVATSTPPAKARGIAGRKQPNTENAPGR